jgi:hypothetical protein
VRTVRQLFGNLSPRKTLAFVVAGVVGLALALLILLEISVRMELAKEARRLPAISFNPDQNASSRLTLVL